MLGLAQGAGADAAGPTLAHVLLPPRDVELGRARDAGWSPEARRTPRCVLFLFLCCCEVGGAGGEVAVDAVVRSGPSGVWAQRVRASRHSYSMHFAAPALGVPRVRVARGLAGGVSFDLRPFRRRRMIGICDRNICQARNTCHRYRGGRPRGAVRASASCARIARGRHERTDERRPRAALRCLGSPSRVSLPSVIVGVDTFPPPIPAATQAHRGPAPEASGVLDAGSVSGRRKAGHAARVRRPTAIATATSKHSTFNVNGTAPRRVRAGFAPPPRVPPLSPLPAREAGTEKGRGGRGRGEGSAARPVPGRARAPGATSSRFAHPIAVPARPQAADL